MISGTCRSYQRKRYMCGEKGCEKVTKRRDAEESICSHFAQKSIKNQFKKSSTKRSPKNIEFYVKGVSKWSQYRYQN